MMIAICITLLVYSMCLAMIGITKDLCHRVVLPLILHVVACLQSMISLRDSNDPEAPIVLFLVVGAALGGIVGGISIILFSFWAKKFIFDSKSSRLFIASLLMVDGYILCAAMFLLYYLHRLSLETRVIVGCVFIVLQFANYLVAKRKQHEIMYSFLT